MCNVHIINHIQNKRQGGARNTAIRHAKGKWAVYIDQDDYFKCNSLNKIFHCVQEYSDYDLLMCDYVEVDDKSGKILSSSHYSQRNSTDAMAGATYVRTQEIPWTPWCTIYSISFLRRNGIEFEENVRFEDTDYVLKSLVFAENVKFLPISLVCHTVSATQQSAVGDNYNAIEDLFKISDRIKKLGESLLVNDESTAKAVLNHHWFMHKYNIMRYLWHLKPEQIKFILQSYKVSTPANGKWLDFIGTNPKISTYMIIGLKPVLSVLHVLYGAIHK